MAQAMLYQDLAHELQSALDAGRWPSGLPSERQLSQRLAVSRHAARKALDLLCQRGLLERKRGSGTYPACESRAAMTTAAAPTLQWLARETGPADAAELLALGLSPGAEVARLRWLARDAAGGGPLLEQLCLSRALLLRPAALAHPAELEARLAPARRLQRLRACNATPQQARLLGLKPGDALLAMRTLSYGAQGQVLLLGERWQPGAAPGLSLELAI